MKTHFRNARLYVNAGMPFPLCYSGAELLDTDKARLPTTGVVADVDCGRCLKILESRGGRLKRKKANLIEKLRNL